MKRICTTFVILAVALLTQLCGGMSLTQQIHAADTQSVPTVLDEHKGISQNYMDTTGSTFSQEGLVGEAPSIPQWSVVRPATTSTNEGRNVKSLQELMKVFSQIFIHRNSASLCCTVHHVSLRQTRPCDYYIFTLRKILI